MENNHLNILNKDKLNKIEESKLEFNLIIDKLISYAIVENNKKNFKLLEPFNDLEMIQQMLDITDEALLILNKYDRAPLMISRDLTIVLDVSSKGGMLTGLELYEIVKLNLTIKANKKMLQSLLKEQIDCKHYREMVDSLYLIDWLDQRLLKTVDETGYILDDASQTLKMIRTKLKNIDARIKSKINEILTKEASKLSETFVTMRNNRYCLAIKAEYKNSFRGVVHDVSGSYQTFYMEPLQVIELTSEKEQLINQEKTEVEKILRSLSKEIGENSEILRSNFQTIVEIDNIFARALLAKEFDAYKPHLNNQGKLNLVNARHPLLRVAKVIPNNISFGDKYLGIVITGPNTGGKTVLLKTVGLLSLMVKYGLLIPADASSNVMIFDQIFCDIGDDQSIANNLSTFSSHMNNIVRIVDNVTPNSLVLLDEVGSGTDPLEGSNLAIAILKYFVKQKVSFITTTHYSALKAFAFDEEKIVNASMEFDDKLLSPTYKLILGVTGSSNAFNIARRLGLKKEIIDNAKKGTINASDDTRGLIIKLERKVKELAEEKKKLDDLILENEKLKEKLNFEYQNIYNEKKKIIDQANEDAIKIVEKTVANASNVIKKLKDMEKREVKLHEIIKVQEELKQVTAEKEDVVEFEKSENDDNNEISVGSDVYIKDYDQYGTVNKILKNGDLNISIGNIVANFAPNDVKLVNAKKVQEQRKKLNKNSDYVSYSKPSVKLTLDLRGCRYEEARDLLDKYIDDLVCSSIKQATIIHGYGTGVIRDLVQKYLKTSPHIDSYRYGGEGEGGFGVTVISLK